MDFLICTDAIIDKDEQFFTQNNITPIEHGMVINNAEIFDGFYKILQKDTIFNILREGKQISTVQGNIGQIEDFFRNTLASGKDALYICFSSALSGTYNTACMLAKQIESEYENKIYILDSKCAAAGQAILVQKALELKALGKNPKEICETLENTRVFIHHYGIIDDLEHLKRGGRISKTSALVGGLIGIKPIIKITHDGALVPFSKARGMNNAIKILVDKINENIADNQTLYISHCDNLKLANKVKTEIISKTSVENIEINFLGNTIGCHVGPDAVAIFFLGKNKI